MVDHCAVFPSLALPRAGSWGMFSAYRHPHTVDIAVGNIKNIVARVKTAVEGQVMGCFRPQGEGIISFAPLLNILTCVCESGIFIKDNKDRGACAGELRLYPLHLIRIVPA